MGKCKLGEEKTCLHRLVSLKLNEKYEAGEKRLGLHLGTKTMKRVVSLISRDLASLGIRENNGTGIIQSGTPKMTRSGDWAKNKITKNNQVRGLGSFSYRVPGGEVIVAFCCPWETPRGSQGHQLVPPAPLPAKDRGPWWVTKDIEWMPHHNFFLQIIGSCNSRPTQKNTRKAVTAKKLRNTWNEWLIKLPSSIHRCRGNPEQPQTATGFILEKHFQNYHFLISDCFLTRKKIASLNILCHFYVLY